MQEFAAIRDAQDVVIYHRAPLKLEFWDTRIQGRHNAGTWTSLFLSPAGVGLQLAATIEAEKLGEQFQKRWNVVEPSELIRDRLAERLRVAWRNFELSKVCPTMWAF